MMRLVPSLGLAVDRKAPSVNPKGVPGPWQRRRPMRCWLTAKESKTI